MAETPSPSDFADWHRRFAAECNNRAWDLASQRTRTEAVDRETLFAAYAAAYHWSQVGQPVQVSRAAVTLAHVLAVLGRGDEALQYARQALEFVEHNECEDWDAAFAHAVMAHAAAVRGDASLHGKHYARARALGEAIVDAEDRRVFLDELAQIPSRVQEKEAR